MNPLGRVSVISRFPVKSLGGEQVPSTQLGALGIAGDRLWALRDLDTGKIISAKVPSVGRRLLTWSATLDASNQPVITIGGVEFGNDLSAAATRASEILGRRVALETASTKDEVYESFWPEIDGMAMSNVSVDLPIAMSTVKGSYVDLAALHIVSTSSLAHLAELAPNCTIDIHRFRPSIVIDTGHATGFVENGWVNTVARIGGATIQFSSVSPRCVMTTLAQPGHQDDATVLQTLATHNRHDFAGFGNFACLGIYAEVTEPGIVSVGDSLHLL